MKLIFLGSGEFGLPTLQALTSIHEVVAVVTQPDRPAGRKRKLTATPIGQWATDHGLTVYKCENVNDESFVNQMQQHNPDASVIIAFGQKLGEPLINALGKLSVNLHGSLLPKYRGAAPINHAIMAGESHAGVSVISLAQRMDAGIVYAKSSLEISPTETAGELHDRLSLLGPDAVGQVLSQLQDGTLHGQQQDETLVTQSPKLSRSDAAIDFSKNADEICCRILGLTPWPGVTVSWKCIKSGKQQPLRLLRVASEPHYNHNAPLGQVLDDYRVAVGSGAIKLLEVQPPGKKPMSIEQFANGHRFASGDILT